MGQEKLILGHHEMNYGTTSEDAICDLQEIKFMGVMSKNTLIKLILSITLFIDHDQINSIGVFLPITPIKFILSQYYAGISKR